jgi:chemotaxis protein methyltransferase CheR
MELSQAEFKELTKHIYKLCGLDIKDEKHYLVRQRLEPLAETVGMGTFKGLIDKLGANSDFQLRDKVIEAITTNETSFFRDVHPFETFADVVLPKLVDVIKERGHQSRHRKGSKVTIWSAASSTGQEPYTIAMLIDEYVKRNPGGASMDDFEIIATDISPKVLSKAIAGSYNDMEISRGLSGERREKYFVKSENSWVIKDELRAIVEFRRMNLTEPFTRLGGVDVIFCRNVLIYFDEETKSRIFSQFSEMLSDTGFLILGAVENTGNSAHLFKQVRHKDTFLQLLINKK